MSDRKINAMFELTQGAMVEGLSSEENKDKKRIFFVFRFMNKVSIVVHFYSREKSCFQMLNRLSRYLKACRQIFRYIGYAIIHFSPLNVSKVSSTCEMKKFAFCSS